jgi:nitroreductase
MRREGAADDFLALIYSRQSIAPKRLVPPGPSRDDLEAIVRAAGSAPDHGALHPFRVIHVADDGRHRLAEIFAAAKLRRLPDAPPMMLGREREKALNAPTLLVACARLRKDVADIPVSEQLIAVGAALQNLLLAAHALGFGAIVLSGEKTRDALVCEAFGLGADEMLVGFISIGGIDASSQRPPKRRRAVEDYLSTWTGPPSPATPRP